MSNKYREAGVDLEAGYESVRLIKSHVARTSLELHGQQRQTVEKVEPSPFLLACSSRGHTHATACKNHHVKLLASLRGY